MKTKMSMMARRSEVHTVRIKSEDWEKWQKEARDDRRSMTEWVSHVVDQYVREKLERRLKPELSEVDNERKPEKG